MDNSFCTLITGAAGFVGTHVHKAAVKAGLNLRTHSRYATTGIDWSADLSDPAAVDALPLNDITTVIHCAAAIPSRSKAFARDNARAAEVLAHALQNAKALRRVVHVSSISVYQRPRSGDWNLNEDAALVNLDDQSVDDYARSKRTAETILNRITEVRPDIAVSHLRASSIYGYGMAQTTLLPTLVNRARCNAPLLMKGPRGYRQNFVHVEDVAALAIAMAVQTDDSIRPALNAFSDDTLGLFELVKLICLHFQSTSAIVDETEDTEIVMPNFENILAKKLHPHFRVLREHLEDVVS